MFTRWLAILLIVLLLVAFGSPALGQNEPTGVDAVTTQIAQALEQALAGKTYEATITLDALPASEVIHAVVRRLQEDPNFTTEKMRDFSYGVLGRHAGAKTEEGRQILLNGLSDPATRALCASALDDAPPEKQTEVVKRLLTYLDDDSTSDSAREAILRTFIKFGSGARAALERLETIFANQQLDRRLRSLALAAMITMDTTEHVLTHIGDEDAAVAILGLATFGAQTKATFNTDELHRQRIYDLFAKALQHPDPVVRDRVLECVKPIYGLNMFIIRSRTDYELNPQLRAAMEHMAANDSEEKLRKEAAEVLDPQTNDRYVERILRKREKAEKSAPP
jgi:hypothetical protein